MAKINARGAKEIARAERIVNGIRDILVYCSDGRILRQTVFSDGHRTGYKVAAKNKTYDEFEAICKKGGWMINK